jgi:hypothetical protein
VAGGLIMLLAGVALIAIGTPFLVVRRRVDDGLLQSERRPAGVPRRPAALRVSGEGGPALLIIFGVLLVAGGIARLI